MDPLYPAPGGPASRAGSRADWLIAADQDLARTTSGLRRPFA
jgi:hypothetical protein